MKSCSHENKEAQQKRSSSKTDTDRRPQVPELSERALRRGGKRRAEALPAMLGLCRRPGVHAPRGVQAFEASLKGRRAAHV